MKDGVLAFLWRDNRVVTVLSTNTQPQQIDTVQRREQDGSRTNVSCPAAMALYNSYMGGVDKNDQLRQYYHVSVASFTDTFSGFCLRWLLLTHTFFALTTPVQNGNLSRSSDWSWQRVLWGIITPRSGTIDTLVHPLTFHSFTSQ